MDEQHEQQNSQDNQNVEVINQSPPQNGISPSNPSQANNFNRHDYNEYYPRPSPSFPNTPNPITTLTQLFGLIAGAITALGLIGNAYRQIWQMEVDIKELKTEDVIEIRTQLKDNHSNLSELTKTNGDAILKLSNEIREIENINAQLHVNLSRLKTEQEKVKEQLSDTEERLKDLEIITGLYLRQKNLKYPPNYNIQGDKQ